MRSSFSVHHGTFDFGMRRPLKQSWRCQNHSFKEHCKTESPNIDIGTAGQAAVMKAVAHLRGAQPARD
jgi:hypothetical protein